MHQHELSIKIGEQDYIFSPLNLVDAESLTRACQFYGYNQAKKAGLSQQELSQALNHSIDTVPTSEHLEAFSISPAGQVETIWLSLVKKQPQITRDSVRDILTICSHNPDTVASIIAFLNKASYPDEKPDSGN